MVFPLFVGLPMPTRPCLKARWSCSSIRSWPPAESGAFTSRPDSWRAPSCGVWPRCCFWIYAEVRVALMHALPNTSCIRLGWSLMTAGALLHPWIPGYAITPKRGSLSGWGAQSSWYWFFVWNPDTNLFRDHRRSPRCSKERLHRSRLLLGLVALDPATVPVAAVDIFL